MVDIKFGTPPEDTEQKRKNKFWDEVAKTLKANPGQWGEVKTYNTTTGAPGRARAINRGEVENLPANCFTAKAVVVDTEEAAYSSLWLRYDEPTDGQ